MEAAALSALAVGLTDAGACCRVLRIVYAMEFLTRNQKALSSPRAFLLSCLFLRDDCGESLPGALRQPVALLLINSQ